MWEPYGKLLRSRLSEPALQAIQHLGNGRPLRGNKIDYDGCVFSWLTQPEIAALQDPLARIAANEVGNLELEEFHQDVVEALTSLKKRQCDVVLSAH